LTASQKVKFAEYGFYQINILRYAKGAKQGFLRMHQGAYMRKEIGKHFLNISLVFLGGVFIQSALKEKVG
jgi:hypothetical protein